MKKSRQSAPAPPQSSWWQRAWPYLLLAALAFGVYANTLGNGFVSDDNALVLANPLVTDAGAIPKIFGRAAWSAVGTAANYYRPLPTLMHFLLYRAFGFDATAFHAMMVLFHVANTLLVFALARRLLASRDAALVAAILFAVHPIHNEAVAWIAVPDVVMTLPVLAALLIFARVEEKPAAAQIAMISMLFFLALLSKEPGAMLLPLLIAYEFLCLRRFPKNYAMYAVLAGVFAIYLVLRVHALGALAPAQGLHHSVSGPPLALSIVATLGEYFAKLLAPVNLHYFYPFEPATTLTPTVILAMLAALAALAIVCWRRGAISFGLFFILATLAPSLNINGVGDAVFGERYLYLPSAGFVIVVAALWEKLAARQKMLAWGAVAATVVASAWILLPRNLDWHDDERLFTAAAAAAPQSGTPLANLGYVAQRRGDLDTAIERFREAAARQPQDSAFHVLLANAYVQSRRPVEAAKEFRQAIELKPSASEAHMGLGMALAALGDAAGAGAEYKTALALRPDYPEAQTALAVLDIKQQDYSAAISLLERAVAENPRYVEAYINLGVAYNNVTRYSDGAAAFKNAIDVGGNHPAMYMAHYNLGIAYRHLNSLDAAAMEFARALQLRPDFAPAREALQEMPSTGRK